MKPLIDKAELKKLIPLATPILLTQITQTSMGFVDTAMAGRVSNADMGALALANSIFFPVIMLSVGILMVMGPIIAHLSGEQKHARIFHFVNQSFWIAGVLSLLSMAVLSQVDRYIHWITEDPEMSRIAVGYIKAVIWGVPAFLGFVCIRSLNEGMSMTKPAMVVGFIGLFANIPANYCFVYGKLGAPALGGIGCGVATTIVMWVMFLSLLFIALRNQKHRFYRTLAFPHRPSKATVLNVLKIGVPVGLAMLCEVGLFCVSALLLGIYSDVVVSSHQVAIMISSMLFIIPLSIGTGVSIRVAHSLGEGNLDAVNKVIRTGYSLALMLAGGTAVLLLVFRSYAPAIFTDNQEVAQMASGLLLFCAIYQIPDACNMVGTSILRGYKDTISLIVITFFSFWIVALPVGYILGRTDYIVPAMKGGGFWIGFIVGLTVSSIFMGLRVRYTRKKTMRRALQGLPGKN